MSLSPEQTLAATGAEVVIIEPVEQAETTGAPIRAARLKVFESHEFTTMQLKPRAYILEPIIRTGGLMMLAAFRGVGKTQVAIGIAHAVATGTAFLRWKAPLPRRVLYIDGEMPGADLQDRLRMFP